ncbi:MAG: hypothetical protein SFU56_03415 [Capsulimonadales bacterium]|nr:hypothetical protein [Capsulimonadales bacterium]
MRTGIRAGLPAAGLLAGIVGTMACAGAQTAAVRSKTAPGGKPPLSITRANLAQQAAFTVVQTLAPKGGDKLVRTYTVRVKGNKARMDYDDPSMGSVRYLANEKGVFFYIPANRSAMKQTLKGGVEGALKVAFAQYATQLAGARKIGVATVSGQPTTVYKEAQSGATIYLGTRPGFRLPVKAVIDNEGGTSTFLVTDIKLNVPLKEDLFALPAGTQIMESSGGDPAFPGVAP